MATYTKLLLSQSTNGQGIKIGSTSGSTGTTIHTATSGSSGFDEVWLWCANSGSSGAVQLSVLWGNTTEPDSDIQVTVPQQGGLVLVAPGLLLNNALSIKAYAGLANVLMLHGFVNRIT